MKTTTKNIPIFSQKLKYIGSLWQRIDGGKTPITHTNNTHTHVFLILSEIPYSNQNKNNNNNNNTEFEW